MQNSALVSGLIALTLLSTDGLAQTAAPEFTFSGFGTLGYAVLDDESAEFRTGVAIDGADDSGSLEVDTRLGLQLDIDFSQDVSSTFQVIAREGEDGDPALGLELGYLQWLVTDNIALRVGRMSLPVYSNSDYREVGFAMPYLRPAPDLYAMIPLRRFNGVDAIVDHEWRDTFFRWQLFAGQSREAIFDNVTLDANQLIGLSLTLERGAARLRISHFDAQVDAENEFIADVRDNIDLAIQQIPELAPVLAQSAVDFSGNRVPLSFDSLALSLDFSQVFFDAEYTRRRVDNWVSNVDGWSVALGTRLNNFQPYVYISKLKEPDGDRALQFSNDDRFDELQLAINSFYSPQDQSTIGIGTRYDLTSNIALKAQIDRISRRALGISFDRQTVDDDSDEGRDVTLFSFVMDFVF